MLRWRLKVSSDGGVTVACSTHVGRPLQKSGLQMTTVCSGTTKVIDSADLRPAVVFAAPDGVIRSTK